MHRNASLFVLSLAAGVLLGAFGVAMWSGEAPSRAGAAEIPASSSMQPDRQDASGEPDAGHLADVVESLARVLDDEINERRILTEQLEQLRSEVRDLTSRLGVRAERVRSDDGVRELESGDTGARRSREERLAAAGFTPEQLEAVERLQAEAQMRQIELDDRARREGWVNTPRYYEELQDLASGATVLRDTFGDELYEQYLFASGMPNRIAVQAVIDTSPARKAGFQPGDVVVRYAGENVYSSRELTDLRSSGQRGEPVTVEILRNGQLLQLTIPRGPMGVSMTPTRVDPAASRE